MSYKTGQKRGSRTYPKHRLKHPKGWGNYLTEEELTRLFEVKEGETEFRPSDPEEVQNRDKNRHGGSPEHTS